MNKRIKILLIITMLCTTLLLSGSSAIAGVNNSYILGFYVDKEGVHPSSYETMLTNSTKISGVAPFWYRLAPYDGRVIEERHPHEGFTPEVIRSIIKKAHEENIQVFMLVHNLLYNGQANGKELASQMLKNYETRKMFIDQVETLIKKYSYDGINVDIEDIYIKDRDKFTLLIKELYERLSPQGYKVTVSVPAKTYDNLLDSWSGPFDYKALGKYSDYIAIMTYDEHGFHSDPGAIASYNWVRNVADYAVKNISPEKILLGIAGYGFDWTEGKRGPTYLSYAQALDISKTNNVDIMWDDLGKVPYLKYIDNNKKAHQVWFENASSLSYKLNIAENFNLGGIAIWRLGLEDPEMWNVIGNNLKAIKKDCTEHPLIRDFHIVSDYAKPALKGLIEKEIISGNQEGFFNPHKPATRAEIVKMLVEALNIDTTKIPQSATFKDVPENHWAYKYVEAALREGIIKGVGKDFFGVNEICTREQLAVMFVRSLKIPEEDFKELKLQEIKRFTDYKAISDWAKKEVEYTVRKGLLKGTSDKTFSPQDFAKREQMAVVTERFIKAADF